MGTRLATYNSNVIHAANTTSGIAEASPSIFSNNGQMDCETMESLIGPGDGSTYGTSVGALDCLDYGDKVFFLNLGTWDPARIAMVATFATAALLTRPPAVMVERTANVPSTTDL